MIGLSNLRSPSVPMSEVNFRRGSHNHRTMYNLIREDHIVRSPILSGYFKEVLIRPEIKYRMERSKERLKGGGVDLICHQRSL